MSRHIASWCKMCTACQQSKVTRHNKFLLKHFITPDAGFDHLHLDPVGPFVISQGFTHVLTIIDRYTRWPEAIPISNTTAPTVARAFDNNWICRYGAPTTITTDQGAQFESRLFTELLSILGINSQNHFL